MLAYRHAFHAGNHADVLKHITLSLVLRHMNRKDKAYRVVDTHAGAGGYSLEGRFAQKKGEFEQGVLRLWDRAATAEPMPEAVADYVALVRQFNGGGALKQYPGSPALAQLLLRPQDQLRLFDIHPTDHKILSAYLGKTVTAPRSAQAPPAPRGEQETLGRPGGFLKGAEVYNADGFEGLKGQLPPSTRRAVVLMDPSYEGTADYPKLVAALRSAMERFAEGVYVVWYPQVTKLEAAQLPHRLQGLADSLAPKGWLHARLTVQQADAQGFGLAGSGMFVINPPHTLHDELLAVLPYLTDVLGQFDGANYLLEHKAV